MKPKILAKNAKSNSLETELWPIDRPKDYPKNARDWSSKAIEKVAASIDAYGCRQPVVVDVNDVIVIGHLRRAAGRFLGLKEIPVHVARDLTPAQIRGLRLADNRTNQESTWNEDLLAEELAELNDLDFDLGLTGFDVNELDALLRDPMDEDKAEEAPPLPEVAVTKPGDLFLLGEHRLLCGDASEPGNLRRLCIQSVDCIWTDPPYGVNYVGKTPDKLRIQGDGTGAANLLHDSLRAAEPHVKPRSPFYVAHPAGPLYVAFGIAVAAAGWQIHQSLVWVKDSMVLGHSDYHYRHEPILYGYAPGEGRAGRGKHCGSRWYGDNAQTSVIEVDRPKRSEEHPTMKPVELIVRCLRNSCPRSAVILDLFLGSGSTLIAAEVSDRICFGLEIDPKYCDVIVKRWQQFTGKEATLDGTKRSFDDIAAERVPAVV